mgnify:FL=1|tara:strand:+ start:98 stop:544 length:447 start_codon:yes stop_codon:yes gene_type:complete
MNTIEVMDYLSESEMKDIAAQVFKERCQDKFNKDHERIISNVGYEIVVKIIKEHYPENLEELVAKKAVEVINGMSSHTLFSPKNAWDRETTGGFEALRKAVKDNDDLIQEKAVKMIEEYKSFDTESYIESLVKDEIINRLFNQGVSKQ